MRRRLKPKLNVRQKENEETTQPNDVFDDNIYENTGMRQYPKKNLKQNPTKH